MVAKALGGLFKLVTPTPKPVREMTRAGRKRKEGTPIIHVLETVLCHLSCAICSL